MGGRSAIGSVPCRVRAPEGMSEGPLAQKTDLIGPHLDLIGREQAKKKLLESMVPTKADWWPAD